MNAKTKSLMRDFDSLAKKHGLKNVHLKLDDGNCIMHVDNQTWSLETTEQWTPLKALKNHLPKNGKSISDFSRDIFDHGEYEINGKKYYYGGLVQEQSNGQKS